MLQDWFSFLEQHLRFSDKLRVRSHEERRCFILGPTQSRMSPSILWYTKTYIEESYIIEPESYMTDPESYVTECTLVYED